MRRYARLALPVALLWLSACATAPGIESVIMTAEPNPAKAVADSAAVRGAPAPVVRDSADALGQKLLLLPFLDSSDFEGPWDIYRGVPRMLGDSLAMNPFYQVVPMDSALVHLREQELRGEIGVSRAADIGAFLGVDWVILGDIEELAMRRFRATVPLGGYRSYEGAVIVDLVLVNAVDGRRGGEVRAEGLVDSKRTGITNPAAFIPLDKQYYFLNDLVWDSDQFRESLVGKALQAWAHEAVAGIAEHIKPPPSLLISKPQIIDIDGVVAYINVGLADGIRNGDKYAVWDLGRELKDPVTGTVLGRAPPRRVGVIQVEQILTDHLSQARVLEGTQIGIGYELRAE